MELWYWEEHTKGVRLGLKCTRTLYSGQSKFQKIDVLETLDYGRLLLLDGLVMLTSRDEFIYHEMMVHPACFVHRGAETALVIGGGDGGTVRELLRHGNLRRIVLCEIDPDVVEVSKRFFPEVASGLLEENSRVELLFQDGAGFVEENPGRFDLILIDSTDPVGPGEILFSEGFYSSCFRALRPGGVLAAQTESPFHHLDLMKGVKERLTASGFGLVRFYTAPVPTYPGGYWSWVFASKQGGQAEGRRLHPLRDVKIGPSDEMVLKGLRYYTPDIHHAAFRLPRFVLEALKR